MLKQWLFVLVLHASLFFSVADFFTNFFDWEKDDNIELEKKKNIMPQPMVGDLVFVEESNVIPPCDVTAIATSSSPDNSFCEGEPIQLIADTCCFNPQIINVSYSWSSPNGYSSNQQNPTNVTEGGTYTLIVSSGSGACAADMDMTTIDITVDSIVTLTLETFSPMCESDAALGLNQTQDNITGNWSAAQGILNNTFDPLAAGEGTHILTFSPDDGQCANDTTTTIVVNSETTPTLETFSPMCESDAALGLNQTQDNITGNWSAAQGILNNTFDPLAAGEGTHILTFSPDDGQCANDTTTTIVVNSETTPTLETFSPMCESDASLGLNQTQSGIIGNWFDEQGILNNTFDPLAAGEGTHILTFSPDDGQCANDTTTTIVVNALPSIQSGTATCGTSSTHYSVTFTINGGSGTYDTVNINSGTGTLSANSGTTSTTFTVDSIPSSTIVTINVEDSNSCTITNIPLNSASCDCTAENGNLDATNFTATTCTSPVNINVASPPLWTGENTTGFTQEYLLVNDEDNLIDMISSTGEFTDIAIGSYTIYAINYEIGNDPSSGYAVGSNIADISGGCSDIDAGSEHVSFTVHPTPNINNLPDIAVCAGEQIDIANFVSTPTGATFNWTNDNTAIGLAASGTGQQIPVFTAASNNTGAPITGEIIIVPSLNGCEGNPHTFTITINSLPNLPSIPNLNPICQGEPISDFTINNPNLNYNYYWYNSTGWDGVGDVSSSTNLNFLYEGVPFNPSTNIGDSSGTFEYKVYALNTTTNCISNAGIGSIIVHALPVITAVSVNCDDETITIGASGTEPFNFILNGSDNTTGIFTILENGVDTLTVQDMNDCRTTTLLDINCNTSCENPPAPTLESDSICIASESTFDLNNIVGVTHWYSDTILQTLISNLVRPENRTTYYGVFYNETCPSLPAPFTINIAPNAEIIKTDFTSTNEDCQTTVELCVTNADNDENNLIYEWNTEDMDTSCIIGITDSTYIVTVIDTVSSCSVSDTIVVPEIDDVVDDCIFLNHDSNSETVLVTSIENDGLGTLRNAINCVNASENIRNIYFLDTITSIQPTCPLPPIIRDDVTIDATIVVDSSFQVQNDLPNNSVTINGNILSEEEEEEERSGNRNEPRTGNGLTANECDNLAIYGLTIINFPNHGLALIDCSDFQIGAPDIGNMIKNNSLGNFKGFDNIFIENASSGRIQSNKIVTDIVIGEDEGPANGIHLSNCQNVVIGYSNENENGQGNTISGHIHGNGILIERNDFIQENPNEYNYIKGNTIGTTTEADSIQDLGNQIGILLLTDKTIIGGNENNLEKNTIAYNRFMGVQIGNGNENDNQDEQYTENYISRNSFYCNAIEENPINSDTIPAAIKLFGDSNNGILPPNITTVSTNSITGTAAVGDTIDVFLQEQETCTSAPCQGRTYLGLVVTGSNGNWSIPYSPIESGTIVATATDGFNNTSEFSCKSISIISCPIVLSVDTINVSCHGEINGSIAVEASGGILPYGYAWSTNEFTPTINNLGAGNYSLTVTDANNCLIETIFTISEPDSLLNIITTNTDSTAIADVSGGTQPYSYEWSNGDTTDSISNLSSGPYGLTVTDANGCMNSSSFTILPELDTCAMTLSADLIDDIQCFGDSTSISLNIVDGTMPYMWQTFKDSILYNEGTDTIINGVTAGLYDIIVVDDLGCRDTIVNIEITQPDSLILTCIANANQGEVQLSISGGVPNYNAILEGDEIENINFVIAMDTTLADLAAGDYTLNLSDDNACPTSCEFTISSEPCIMTLSANLIENIRCFGDSTAILDIIITNGTASFNWTDNYGNSGNSSDNPINIENLWAGDYSITITDSENCIENLVRTITQPSELVLTCTPNVNQGEVQLNVSGGVPNYNAILVGDEIENINFAIAMDTTLADLTAGNYTLNLSDDNDCPTSCNFTISSELDTCAMTLSANLIDGIRCFGDSTAILDIIITNGTAPFDWMDNYGNSGNSSDNPINIENLWAGDYEIIITDSEDCIETLERTITQPSELVLTCEQLSPASDSLTNDGIGRIIIAGGTADYQVFLEGNLIPSSSDTIRLDNLTIGTYNISVIDNNGCTASHELIIETPSCLINIFRGILDCNNNNTSLNSSDDTFAVYFNASLENMPGTQFTVSLDGEVQDTFNYGNSSNDTLSFLVADSPFTLIFQDIDNPNCTFFYEIPEQESCSIDCESTMEQLEIIDCDDNNTPNDLSDDLLTIAITVSAINPAENEQFSLEIDDIDYGFYAYDSTIIILNVNVNNPNSIQFLVEDSEHNCFEFEAIQHNGCGSSCATFEVERDITSVSCLGSNDGMISVIPSGGQESYTFAWDNGGTTATIGNLAAGTYIVTITDALNCSTIDTIDVPQLESFTINCGEKRPTSPNINSGIAYFTIQGGLPPFYYEWNGGQDSAITDSTCIYNLAAGFQSVTVTDQNGCTNTCDFEITVTPCPIGVHAEIFDCNDNDTPSDPTDDIFELSIFASHVNIQSSGFNIYLEPDSLLSIAPYAYDSIHYLTFPANNNTFTLTFTDLDNVQCTNSRIIEGKENCSDDCELSIDHLQIINCDDNDTPDDLSDDILTINMNVSALNPGNNFSFSLEINEEDYGTHPYDSLLYIENISPNSSGLLDIEIVNSDYFCFEGTSIDYESCDTCLPSPDYTLSVNHETAQLNDGTASIQINNDQSTYSLQWSNGEATNTIDNLDAATYYVTVTYGIDDCVLIDSVTVEPFNLPDEPCDSLELSFTVDNISCSGGGDGAITAQANGGTPPYTFIWNTDNPNDTINTIGNLDADTYKVTITDTHNCSITDSIILHQPDELIIMCGQQSPDTGNQNGVTFFNIENGVAPFIYNWGTGDNLTSDTFGIITDLAAGMYNLTITDENDCQIICSFEILDDTNNCNMDSNAVPSTEGCNDNGTSTVEDDFIIINFFVSSTFIDSFLLVLNNTDTLGKFPSSLFPVFTSQFPANGDTLVFKFIDCNTPCTSIKRIIAPLPCSDPAPCDSLSSDIQIPNAITLDCKTTSIMLFPDTVLENVIYEWQAPAFSIIRDSFLEVTTAGRYYLIVSDSINNCSVIDSIDIHQIIYPIAQAEEILLCGNMQGNLKANDSLPDHVTGYWTTNSDNWIEIHDPTAFNSNFNFMADASEGQEYELTWSLSAEECANYSSMTKTARFFSTPEIENIGHDFNLFCKDSESVNIPTKPKSHLFYNVITPWDSDFGTIDTLYNYLAYTTEGVSIHEINFEYEACNQFCLEQNEFPCDTASVQINIAYECTIDKDCIPNAILVGDENNEKFEIPQLDPYLCPINYNNSQLLIVNRWGNVVYSAIPYNNDWKGGGLPNGVYFYVLKTGKQTFKGYVTIFGQEK